jgi:hypothetical protein
MAAINAKPTLRDRTGVNKIWYFRGVADAGLSIGNGDTLKLNMKKVFEVRTNKPTSVTGWSYSESTGTLTFTTTGAITGVFLTVVGRA